MRRYEISRTASYDLEEIVDYLSDRGFESGEQFLKNSLRTVEILSASHGLENPTMA